MKKLLLSLLTVAAAAGSAAAQVEIGLKVSPSYTYLRADATTGGLASESGKVSFGGGVLFDLFFGENYAFSTGAFLTGKGGTVKYDVSSGSGLDNTQKIALQYIEVPATVKLFTNEVATDVRLYFQVGGSLAVPIATRIDGGKTYNDPILSSSSDASDHIFFLDANAILGLGAEYQLAKSTKAIFGLSYHRGLIDVDRYFDKDRNYKDASIKNNVFALDLGLKF